MRDRKWQLALVGVGRGSRYARLFAEHPRCQVTACCDTSPEALARFGGELGLPAERCFSEFTGMLQTRPDAVFLGTPIPLHAEQTIAALEAGAAVLCEVTAARTVEECRQIAQTVHRTGGTYMLAENCVYWPFIQQWRQWVQAGRLGQVFYAECEYLHPIPEQILDPATGKPHWRTTRAPLHYCSHSLGPILHILGDRITRACGLGDGHRILPEGGEGGIDIQVGLFQTAGGVIIKLLRTSVAPRRPRMHFYNLQGTGGFVETDRLGPAGKGLLYVQGEMEKAQEIDCVFADGTLGENARAGGYSTGEYRIVEEFLTALEARRAPSLGLAAAMDMTLPGLIAHESAKRGGAWLDVPQIE